MTKDYNIILEIKNGNKEKKAFFKSKLKEQAKKINLEDFNEIDLEEILSEALNTYEENSPIPFIFYMNGILMNKTNNNYCNRLTDDEIKIIQKVLTSENGNFLSLKEIAKQLEISLRVVENTLERFYLLDKKNSNYINSLFKNYKKILDERNKYFATRKLLTDQEIEILGYFIGKVKTNGTFKELKIKEIAKKYNMSVDDTKKILIRIFKLLKYSHNQELIIKKYGPIANKIIRKQEFLDLHINYEDLVIREIRYNKKTNSPKKEKPIIKLTEQEKEIINLLIRKYHREITVSELLTLTGYKQINALEIRIKNILKKINRYPWLLKELETTLPDISKININNSIRLYEQRLIEALIVQNKDNLTDDEILKILDYKAKKAFIKARRELFNKILNNKDFYEEIKKEYKELLETNSFLEYKRIIYKNSGKINYKLFANLLFEIIKNKNTKTDLKEKAKDLYYILKDDEMYTLPKKAKAIIGTINIGIIDNLPLEEIVANLGYLSIKELINDIHHKIFKMEEQEKKEKSALNGIVTTEGLKIIKELYTPIASGYHTQKDMQTKYALTAEQITGLKKNFLTSINKNQTKIAKNWPSYKEDILIKDNFKESRSVTISEEELENIKLFFQSSNYEITKNNILESIYNLEASVYGEFAKNRNLTEKIILCLRLGFCNNHPFSSSEIAKITNLEEENIINLTKECLIASKKRLTQKGPSKIKF